MKYVYPCPFFQNTRLCFSWSPPRFVGFTSRICFCGGKGLKRNGKAWSGGERGGRSLVDK